MAIKNQGEKKILIVIPRWISAITLLFVIIFSYYFITLSLSEENIVFTILGVLIAIIAIVITLYQLIQKKSPYYLKTTK